MQLKSTKRNSLQKCYTAFISNFFFFDTSGFVNAVKLRTANFDFVNLEELCMYKYISLCNLQCKIQKGAINE